MKKEFIYWGVLRPDGNLLPSTFHRLKMVASMKAAGLCRKQFGLSFRKIKKQQGYRLVTVRVEIIGGLE